MERRKWDQPVVMRFTQRHIPIRNLDMPRIGDAGENVGNALIPDLAVRQVFWKVGLAFEKALYLDLCFEPSRGIAFKSLLYDGRQRLVAHQHFAVTFALLVFVANGRLEHPIAVHATGAHPVERLFGVLAALVLRHRGQDVLV
ncbi:hypothetical protein QEZ48_15490 [Aquamicrobium lusatiense]|nr:hypothetical protein [Aquamicrobium lusatiense]MDH4992220.1 hypothetical protein [Aquamicrobium lusatiense]